jgi:hypothetical protein
MSAHELPPLAVNSKSKRKVNSLPPLGFELVIIGMLAHLSNHSTKSHPRTFTSPYNIQTTFRINSAIHPRLNTFEQQPDPSFARTPARHPRDGSVVRKLIVSLVVGYRHLAATVVALASARLDLFNF